MVGRAGLLFTQHALYLLYGKALLLSLLPAIKLHSPGYSIRETDAATGSSLKNRQDASGIIVNNEDDVILKEEFIQRRDL